jgi:hypothetical protein
MCTGAEFAIIALATTSTAIGAASAYQQAQAAQDQAQYQAAVAGNNAQIAAQNEADIIQRGSIATERARTRINQTIGTARTALATRGLVMNETGTTSALLQEDLGVAGASDILTMKSNIEREARRAKIEGVNFRAQQGLYNLQAASINPLFAGIVGGLSGFNSAGGANFIQSDLIG